MIEANTIKLTEYSHGAGCGCKISPQVLDQILAGNPHQLNNPNLLVGNEGRDDAAVYDLGDGTAIISTTDFFMPIVDDAYDFGRIAAVNAISDVYAMGGSPMMAIAILGWPVDKLPAELANQVLEGARAVCKDAGIPLAGGHSIDSPEPIFGLAVTGKVNVGSLKRNSGAPPGCKLFLTKPLGLGILTTAGKHKKLQAEHANLATEIMVHPNKAGEVFGKYAFVKALTDVTGFGLLGHLIEMCEASKTSAQIQTALVPIIAETKAYLSQNLIPGGTQRNYDSYGQKVSPISEEQKFLLCDPQTSGGLLVAVSAEYEKEFIALANSLGMQLASFGQMTESRKLVVEIQ